MLDTPAVRKMSDDELAQAASNCAENSMNRWKTDAEFKRREMLLQRDVAKAQISATWWTRASAIAVAVSVVVTALGILIERFAGQ
ncbi:hypothetical protein KM176_16570 [Pseudooceanicola sp. CBS1P-1]|uniref:Uncharacterized protein n=1 Tax=Pseudooceanicola albus TaxID=2692189 RepID=A0A6L7G6F4_9RHOB|nr:MULTISPECIES: hypothetical protein [Pseudooceanicola]MBT9385490.1 hypothetical protein [Pseudooceanicola endophyticus]MXN19098.1 hypothetical protein [Pseudooceanicola albus]